MKRKILFAVGSVLNLYVIPYICLMTWEGDRGETLMGIGFGLIPLGWVLLSLLWGIFCRGGTELLFPFLCTDLLSLPMLFVPNVGPRWDEGLWVALGETIHILSIIWCAALFITSIAASIGYLARCGVRKLSKK